MTSSEDTGSRASYNNEQFKPFQSGCSICYPSKDFAGTNISMKSGGSVKSLISNLPGKNLYNLKNDTVPLDKLTKDNYGISYNTSAGGSKNSSNKIKLMLKNIRKTMKGGTEEESSMASIYGGRKKKSSSKKTTKKTMKGGTEEEHSMSSMASMHSMAGGKKKKSSSKKTIKGGTEEEHSMSSMASMYGGKKKKSSSKKTTKKTMKGGTEHQMMHSEEESSMNSMMGGKKKKSSSKKTTKKTMKGGTEEESPMASMQSMAGGKKKKSSSKKTTKKTMKGGTEEEHTLSNMASMIGGKKKKTSSKKTTKKTMKGGEESWGATGMPIQFYDPKAQLASYPFNSGLNAKSAYGPVDPKDVGVGMLAPMNTSKTQIGSVNMNNKTGGKKILFKKKSSNKKIMKNKRGGDGSDFISTLNSRGPANAPDKYWDVDGKTWFRQFNTTAEYIPNSQLAKAATPLLVDGPKNQAVIGYNAFSDVFAPIKGGKSKPKSKAKPKSKPKTKGKSKK